MPDSPENIVRMGRVELPRVAPPDPKSGAYANFATSAYMYKGQERKNTMFSAVYEIIVNLVYSRPD